MSGRVIVRNEFMLLANSDGECWLSRKINPFTDVLKKYYPLSSDLRKSVDKYKNEASWFESFESELNRADAIIDGLNNASVLALLHGGYDRYKPDTTGPEMGPPGFSGHKTPEGFWDKVGDIIKPDGYWDQFAILLSAATPMAAPDAIGMLKNGEGSGPLPSDYTHQEMQGLALDVQGNVLLRDQTVNLTATAEGSIIATATGKGLRPAQINAAKALGLVPGIGIGAHAEVNGIYSAGVFGLTPVGGVTTNKMCPPCQNEIGELAGQGGLQLQLTNGGKGYTFTKIGGR